MKSGSVPSGAGVTDAPVGEETGGWKRAEELLGAGDACGARGEVTTGGSRAESWGVATSRRSGGHACCTGTASPAWLEVSED